MAHTQTEEQAAEADVWEQKDAQETPAQARRREKRAKLHKELRTSLHRFYASNPTIAALFFAAKEDDTARRVHNDALGRGGI